MYCKKLCFVTILLLVICNQVIGKKIKKNKRPKVQEESSTIQPNVVEYSTFGFNDVKPYDGFVPTSPEYSNYFTGGNQATSTRLYAPAFPSAADSTGFSDDYESQSFDGQSFGANENEGGHSGMSYTSNTINLLSSKPVNGDQNKDISSENINKQHKNGLDAPVYGTKINTSYKIRPTYIDNTSELDANNNGHSKPSEDNYFNFHENKKPQGKPLFSEINSNYQNFNTYTQNIVPQENDNFKKPNLSDDLNFPRIIDFTNLSTKHYPTELDKSKLNVENLRPQSPTPDPQIDNSFSNMFSYNKVTDKSPKRLEEHYNVNNNEDVNKNSYKFNTFSEPNFTQKHISHYKHSESTNKNPDQKKKINNNPWASGNYSDMIKDWKDEESAQPVKGYGYSTNYSNMHFRYDGSESKKPYNPDEIIPASSNIVDLNYYRLPEKDYSDFKKMPKFTNDEEYFSGPSYKEKHKPSDYLNQFKNSYNNNVQSSTSSYWGNAFQSTDYSSFGDHPKKSQYDVNEINQDHVVNIAKRPHRLSFKGTENKQLEWPPSHYRPQNINKPAPDWTKDFLNTRYKSEEELLGLRTHDTSHSTYLPTYKPSNSVDNDEDFKQLVEKWKESYLKTKHKNEPIRDYESYGAEIKYHHIPIWKPYPIEVPHPVIVPVPQPFPVRVPISKPVAVPVLKELTVPIEKPVLYPVYKNVPYPIEKPVPVTIEKEVTLPVERPYPVHSPYVRPVFHHTKSVHEDSDHFDEEDFPRRPENKKPSYYKKRIAYGSRNQSRRPSRTSYQERNRRRWPNRRHPSGSTSEYRPSSRPNRLQYSSPYRHSSFEREIDEDEHKYGLYCRNTENC